MEDELGGMNETEWTWPFCHSRLDFDWSRESAVYDGTTRPCRETVEDCMVARQKVPLAMRMESLAREYCDINSGRFHLKKKTRKSRRDSIPCIAIYPLMVRSLVIHAGLGACGGILTPGVMSLCLKS